MLALKISNVDKYGAVNDEDEQSTRVVLKPISGSGKRHKQKLGRRDSGGKEFLPFFPLA